MNFSSVIVSIVLIIIVLLAIRSIIRDKKNGKSSCGGSCGSRSSAGVWDRDVRYPLSYSNSDVGFSASLYPH